MEITISVVLAYLVSGISYAVQNLTCRPMYRPGWTAHPTIGNIILVVLKWPLYRFINDAYPYSSRAVAFAVFSVIWQMGVLTGFVWCCIAVSVYIFDSTSLQFVTAMILFGVGVIFVLPLLNLLMIPLMLFVAWPLDLLFPHDKNMNVSKTEDDRKVEHTGIGRLSSIENELKNKKENTIDTVKVPDI